MFSTLKGKESAKVVDDYVATARASAKRLSDAIGANDQAALREICKGIQGSAGKCGFEGVGALAAEVIATLEAAKSIKDVNSQVQSLCRLCERVAPRPESKNH